MRPHPPRIDPDDPVDAARRAVALVTLAEDDDQQAFALAVACGVRHATDAGALVYALVQLTRSMIGQPALEGRARREVLDGIAADLELWTPPPEGARADG